MSDLQISVEGTPNPHAAKFVLDRELPGEGSRSYREAESAADDPLAARLFEVPGVRALLIVENFITVTKSPTVEWSRVIEPIREAIEINHAFIDKSDEEEEPEPHKMSEILEGVSVEDFPGFSDERKAEIIDAMLDHSIRPALANDGGGISLIGVEGNTVKIHYQGACGSCPSASTGTLQYIENFLQETLSPTLKVQTL